MLSMTGYGKGEYKEGGIELTVEVKSVNNRYLDAVIKSAKAFSSCDELIRSAVREKITRGHVEVYINFADKRERRGGVSVDIERAKAYISAAAVLKEAFPNLSDDVTLSSVLKYPDVLYEDGSDGPDEAALAALKSALCGALEALNKMRAAEGEKLKKDILSRAATVEGIVADISARAPLVVSAYQAKLKERMEAYLKEVPVDEAKLLNEVAAFTDKCNIDEELTRLRSHLCQLREICAREQVGRSLDFLIQEFNREANTVCSKSNDIEITRLGLSLKNEIEKIREQVQNIE